MNKVLQPIESNFIKGIQTHAQMAGGKSFFMHPNKVVFRDIAEKMPLVLSKRHGMRDDID